MEESLKSVAKKCREEKINLEIVRTKDLLFTDDIRQPWTFFDLHDLWDKSIINSAYKKRFKFPNIRPIVVYENLEDRKYIVLDGNHRGSAAWLNSKYVPAIVIKEQAELDKLRFLIERGQVSWPPNALHQSFNLEALLRSYDERGSGGEVVSFFSNNFEDEDYVLNDKNGIYFNPNPFNENALRYCIGRIVHLSGDDANDLRLVDYFVSYPKRNLEEELSEGLHKRIKHLAERNPIIRSSRHITAEDIASNVVCLLSSSYRLRSGKPSENDKEKY